MIRIGTSGYSFDDWVGLFYPKGTPKNQFLDYYRQYFDTTELNFTYYRMPTQQMLTSIASQVDTGFLFSVKAYGEITHDRADNPRPVIQQFNTALRPLMDEDKFACVLAQFPYSFHPTAENRDYLKRLSAAFDETPVIIEFRNRAWVSDVTFSLLRELALGFCCVDEPQLGTLVPPVAITTRDIAYVRFHGRNKATWWQHHKAWERYDYSYTEDELQEWVPRIQALDEEHGTRLTLVYMNNCWQAQAIDSANLLGALLEKAGANVSLMPEQVE